MGTLFSSPEPKEEPKPESEGKPEAPSSPAFRPLRLVMISDTHNDHRALDLPPGDVLIHAGDFTNFGKIGHVKDFNDWLGTQPHPHKIVVNGNHENNAPWKHDVRNLLSNAIFLKDEAYHIPRQRSDGTCCEGDEKLTIFGTEFFWPMKEGTKNPHYDAMEVGINVLVTHGPVLGYVDDGMGCPAMRSTCDRLAHGKADRADSKLQLVVSGHIHSAHGTVRGEGQSKDVMFVNAASAGRQGRKATNSPVVYDI